jgi:pyrimidine-nucleoside phosphorylase
MTAYEIIQKKQRGDELTRAELAFMLEGMLAGTVPDYQIAALLMATYFKGMTAEETYLLTDIMLNSGEVNDFSQLSIPRADKHSTGGVGDKVTLILAPLLAAGGVAVPMISGRGLGHTGGTLDKLEAIPGFSTSHTPDAFRSQVEKIGLCITSQSDLLVPADRRLYALRDVTATVESVPLITGSIMSKKLAEGIDTLLLDVKVGSGAIFQTIEEALKLTHSLLAIGQRAEVGTAALITQMNQPLGNTIGNWNEVVESVECLNDDWPDDLREVTLAQAGVIFQLTGHSKSISDGIVLAEQLIENGKALAKFYEFVEAQGGDCSVLKQNPDSCRARYRYSLTASATGYVEQLNARTFGLTAVAMGAGRRQMNDRLDINAGITLDVKVGDQVEAGAEIGSYYADRELPETELTTRLQKAILISSSNVQPLPAILKLVTPSTELSWSEALNESM